MNRQRALRQQALHRRDVFRLIGRQRFIRENRIAKALQLSFDEPTRLLSVIAALGKIDRWLARHLRLDRDVLVIAVARLRCGLEGLEQLRNLPCQPCDVLVIKLCILLPIDRIEFERRTILEDKKLISKDVLHGSRERLLRVNRRLDHLEHPRFVADHQPPGLLRALTEFAGLSRAPFRIEVAGCHDGNENGRLLEPRDDLVRENVVALQFLVSPDLRLVAHAHAQNGLQGRMKPADPSLLPGRQGLIVDVGVANEEALFETHWVTPDTVTCSTVGQHTPMSGVCVRSEEPPGPAPFGAPDPRRATKHPLEAAYSLSPADLRAARSSAISSGGRGWIGGRAVSCSRRPSSFRQVLSRAVARLPGALR